MGLKEQASEILEKISSGSWNGAYAFLGNLNVSYSFLGKAVISILSHIANLEEGKEVEDLVTEWIDEDIPVYTGELTSWIAEDDNHVEYITEALDRFGVVDGFTLLKMAYYIALEDVYYKVLRGLKEGMLEVS